MTVAELTHLSIAEASELIRHGKLSPVELTEACLERIGLLDAHLNAFITVAREEALSAAQQATNALAKGSHKGPLHGIPLAVKDLFATAGLRTTAGSRILADNTPTEDATAVARLKGAGAVILGKLNLHEFAFGATGVNPHYGAARNPWDGDRISGGSSSGSAVAVAAGECLGALGTDTGGSIRIPSSLCGIVGLKPTYGRVSRRGVVPLSWSLDHVGPMARTVEDAALILGAIAGHDPLDASSSDEPVPDFQRELTDGKLKGLRIGVPREFFFEDVDLEVQEAVRLAITGLSRLGAQLRDVSLPHIAEAPAAVNAIILPEALAYHRRWLAERPDDYGDDVRERLELGATYLAVHHVQAQRFRSLIIEEWRREVFDKIDLLVTPTTPIAAPAIDESDFQTTLNLVRFTGPFNLSGLPAVSLPCGFTKSGLPIGMQLVGRWFEEGMVLWAAHAYQQSTDWHKRQPPLS